MTKQKKLKDRVRARMARTGEHYTTARRHVLAQALGSHDAAPETVAGQIPAVAALRTLLVHSSAALPESVGTSEALLMGIAGGIGVGVYSFRYEADDQSSFFLAGRHLWEDDEAYLRAAVERLGLKAVVSETAGAKAARKNLDRALEPGPVIAWVDMASLPHRALPANRVGSGYHVVAVHEADEDSALIVDLADDPIRVPRAEFEAARGRIRKFKNRLLGVAPSGEGFELDRAVRSGIAACADGLRNGRANHTVDGFATWADRLEASSGKHAWASIFPSGRHLWTALTWTYDCIEHYGTGGGLCRSLFADFLAEVSRAGILDGAQEVSERYAELGRQWTELARAALPDGEPLFREARALLDQKAEVYLSEGANGTEQLRQLWERYSELGREAADSLPLDEEQSEGLRHQLAAAVRAIHAAEVDAARALGDLIA